MIYHFIDGLEDQTGVTKEELELLVNGGSVQKNINQELTYKELYSSMDNKHPLFRIGIHHTSSLLFHNPNPIRNSEAYLSLHRL